MRRVAPTDPGPFARRREVPPQEPDASDLAGPDAAVLDAAEARRLTLHQLFGESTPDPPTYVATPRLTPAESPPIGVPYPRCRMAGGRLVCAVTSGAFRGDFRVDVSYDPELAAFSVIATPDAFAKRFAPVMGPVGKRTVVSLDPDMGNACVD